MGLKKNVQKHGLKKWGPKETGLNNIWSKKWVRKTRSNKNGVQKKRVQKNWGPTKKMSKNMGPKHIGSKRTVSPKNGSKKIWSKKRGPKDMCPKKIGSKNLDIVKNARILLIFGVWKQLMKRLYHTKTEQNRTIYDEVQKFLTQVQKFENCSDFAHIWCDEFFSNYYQFVRKVRKKSFQSGWLYINS